MLNKDCIQFFIEVKKIHCHNIRPIYPTTNERNIPTACSANIFSLYKTK